MRGDQVVRVRDAQARTTYVRYNCLAGCLVNEHTDSFPPCNRLDGQMTKSDGQSSNSVAVFWIMVSAATFDCAFVLPFHFPLHEPVYSAAYTAGEDIRVVAISVAAISILAALACAWFRTGSTNADPSDRLHLSRTYLWWGIAAIVAGTSTLGSRRPRGCLLRR
jgi:hypothetical protein